MSESYNRDDELLASILPDDIPESVNQKLRGQLVEFRGKVAGKRVHTARLSTGYRRRIWIGMSAVAAALLISLSTFILWPQVGFADVIAAVKRLPWVHARIEHSNGEIREIWYSARDDISAFRDKEWIEYFDHKVKVYYSYDIQERVLYRVPEYTPRRADARVRMAEALRLLLQDKSNIATTFDNLEFMGSKGSQFKILNQSSRRVEESGRKWLDFHLTVHHSEVPGSIQLFIRVDPETNLPQLFRMEGKWEGKPVSMEEWIDYPKQGPTNVYDLGVPRTAELVNRVPSDDIMRILRTIRAGRQRMDDYRAIVVSRMDDPEIMWWINERPMIFYRKGKQTRVDDARWTEDMPIVEKPAANANMESWWRERAEDFVFCPFYITDDAAVYSIDTQPATDARGVVRLTVQSVKHWNDQSSPGESYPPYYSRTPEYVCRPPLGIPQQSLEPIIEFSPTDGPEGTILLRVVRSGRAPGLDKPSAEELLRQPDAHRFWLDPKRDYVALRWDMVGAGGELLSSTVVEELKQSPRGVWYATRFRIKAVPPMKHDEVFDVYMDFDDELPDSLFEPPTVGQVFSN